jgi:formylglycine-generating enzyme required for sulfatase activity/uncharacterized caspase-like protein
MLCLCLLAAPAWAQKRMALVIGNADYTHESRLNNPVNDARLIAGTLRGLGFAVDERFNLRQRDMVLAINRFVRESAGADTALLYFAGHGMQPVEGGRNYLLAVDADVQHDDALDSDAVPADRIVEQMERSANPARLRLVVLDACRNNRQAQRARSGVRGLARMSPGDDYTLIAFSTNDQSVALDGRGAHSPYAEALNRHLSRARELPVRRIFELTATDVRQATGQQQRPRTYGDLDSRVGLDGVVLAEATAAAGAALVPSPQTAQPALAQAGVSLADLEREQQARQAWAQWQQRMQADFDRIVAFQGGADLRAQAWQRFLDTWRDDNPTGGDDERLRTQARLALTQAQGDAERQQLVAASNVPVPSGGATGGAVAGVAQTFKDSGECPEMVVIPAGRFLMGSPSNEERRDADEGPQRWVDVARFAMGKHEVTQRQWEAVMGSNPSTFRSCGPNCPVERVSWNDAQEFVRRLNQRTGQNYRLSSEAEWEYAARAGSASIYPWGVRASRDHANYGTDACCGGRAEGRDRWKETAPVGQFPANAFGLHDMHGNVWEWVQDVWHDNYAGAPIDGSAWVTGGDQSRGVLRGGSWSDAPQGLRSANRGRGGLDDSDIFTGLRIARTL